MPLPVIYHMVCIVTLVRPFGQNLVEDTEQAHRWDWFASTIVDGQHVNRGLLQEGPWALWLEKPGVSVCLKHCMACQPPGCCSEASDYKRVLEVNTVGPFLVTQAFYPLLLKRDTRTIVNVSSGLGSISDNRDGETPLTGKIIAYCSSKAALNMRARLALSLTVLYPAQILFEALLLVKKILRIIGTCLTGMPLHFICFCLVWSLARHVTDVLLTKRLRTSAIAKRWSAIAAIMLSMEGSQGVTHGCSWAWQGLAGISKRLGVSS